MKTIKKIYRSILRLQLNKKNRNKLENTDVTIFCNNCTGGIIYHDLGLEFKSPTINLYFSASDFVEFCENLDFYLSEELIEINSERSYPVAKLGKITIFFVHYKNFEQAKKKWNERRSRINKNNMFFVMIDRDGCTPELAKRFNSLPYKNKVFLTYRNIEGVNCAFIKKEWQDIDKTRILTEYLSKFTGKRFIDSFDYVSFLNGKTC